MAGIGFEEREKLIKNSFFFNLIFQKPTLI